MLVDIPIDNVTPQLPSAFSLDTRDHEGQEEFLDLHHSEALRTLVDLQDWHEIEGRHQYLEKK